MGKVEDQRALKDARRAEQQRTSPTTPRGRAQQAPPASGTDRLCGHLSMSGKTCTRPLGHIETSHRY